MLHIAIVGTGPAGLMAGTVLAEAGHKITFFEQKAAPGRKFLVAGHGGFNLTNSLEINAFVEKYDAPEIQSLVRHFSKDDFCAFLRKIGIETIVGSSGKVFPLQTYKPIDVLNAWINHLKQFDVSFRYKHVLQDISEKNLTFLHEHEQVNVEFDHLILALGGKSWSKTGSDGKWLDLFKKLTINCEDFYPSNSGFEWKNFTFPAAFHGTVWKNVSVKLTNIAIKGEVTISSYGLEGSPIYALNPVLRKHPDASLYVDFKPSFTAIELEEKLRQCKNTSQGLKNLKIPASALYLLRQCLTKEQYTSATFLAHYIKNCPIEGLSFRPMEEVISVGGGVSWSELNENLSLKKYPAISVCGEMLNWDTCTGGFLIQGAVASGFAAGQGVLRKKA
jgi:uncharacterized flavoprotein (TIGR03862 family)